MTEDPLITRKREQRVNLIRALYGFVDGKEGHSISPQQWLGFGERSGIPKEDIPEVMRFLKSEGLLVNKPASEAVALTHKGIVFVEEQSAQRAELSRKQQAALPDKILAVLESSTDTLQLFQLRAALPQFRDLPEEQWFEALKELRAKGIVSFEAGSFSSGKPVNETYHFGIVNRGRINLSESMKIQLTTLGEEAVEIAYERKESAQDRDGVYYLFTVTDLKNGRGKRRVMIFRAGSKDFYPSDYDGRINNVRWNLIRRAFDTGALSFDVPFDEERYIEIKLSASDFRPRPQTNDADLRRFMEHEAYWIGYKLAPSTAPIQFDLPVDLEYLGVTREAVKRALWVLQERKMVDRVMEGLARVTENLVTNYEQSHQEPKKGPGRVMTDTKNVFVVHGHDVAMESVVARFLDQQGLKPIILHEQPNEGQTIIEKFEKHAMNAAFAVVLLSPDDMGSGKDGPATPRPRQNVILELGFFIGRLGRSRVCAVYSGGELPSDLHGVLWVPFSGNWMAGLIKELRAAGMQVKGL